jgi:pSer/pThr/pTyr-binding forkhead associated (FHA) protein
MTAVASAPNLQPLPRLGWNSSGSGGQGGFGAEDVSRIFATRKGPQRTNSTSSLSSNTSKASNNAIQNFTAKQDSIAGKEKDTPASNKYSRGFWPQSKPETQGPTTSNSLHGRSLSNPPVPGSTPSTTPSTGPPLVPSQKMVQPSGQVQTNGVRVGMQPTGPDPPALLVLSPMNGTFERKQINVPLFPDILRIGRQTNAKTIPTPSNGYFDSKVLSRQHAEIWADRSGKIWIRDVKSSNGTFVNGVRLSPESRDSEPHELRENDMLELGIDIVSEDQKSIVHHKVSAKVEHAGIPTNATSVLDLNLADIEPGSGGGLSMITPNGQMRGRLGSQGSITSNGRPNLYAPNGNNVNGYGVQRHMGAWLSPITIEQVVKRLTVSSFFPFEEQ